MSTKYSSKTVAIIVAHPDDETLWAGGTILSHPTWKCFVVCLCGGSDNERSVKFATALKILKSEGIMGDMNDGPEQTPMEDIEVERTILQLMPPAHFDIIITHNPTGEYTKHLRHEEVSKAVIKLWNTGKLSANELWTFAYGDGNNTHTPYPNSTAPIYRILSNRIWFRKFNIITETYGFKPDSFEAETAPKAEAFWQFTDPSDAKKWIKQCENELVK